MSTTINATTQLATEECCNCGVIFAMPQEMRTRRLSDGKSFYCPHGHPQSYTDSTEAQLKRRVAQLQSSIEHKDAALVRARQERDQFDRHARAMRGVATRIRNRVQHGVCPCCKRMFSNLAAHMATKHPLAAETTS